LLLILLDANAIIGFHELGVWDQIVKQHEVYIPSIVLRSEVFWYEDSKGWRHEIDLVSAVGNTIKELECTPEELEGFSSRYNRSFLPEIHAGESEALAILEKQADILFCTCDKAALVVLGFAGLSERGISFEHLMQKTGLAKPLAKKHTQFFFEEHVGVGQRLRIEHFGN
jgi:hypothetical protein